MVLSEFGSGKCMISFEPRIVGARLGGEDMVSHFRLLNCVAAALLLFTQSAANAADGSLLERTFSQILSANDTVLIARRLSDPVPRGSDRDGWGQAEFQVVDLLKDDSTLLRDKFAAPCRIADATSELFLLAASQRNSSDTLRWRLSQPMTGACRQHVVALRDLEATGAERLAYFWPFLQHPDKDVSANAHLEFVLASDESFSAASAQMDRVAIVRWLKQIPDLPDGRTRLYLAMLARCGTAADGDWLRDKVVAEQGKPLLDAWMGCYLALKGPDGLRLINELYLANPQAEFRDTYSAIIALRFVRDQIDESIASEQIIRSLRLVLDIPLLADLVVPDLAYMRDWESMDRIVELFEVTDQQFIRVAVVNYVRACPNADASERLVALREIDEKAVKKAHTFFPDGFSDAPAKTRIRRHYRANSVFRC